MKKLFRVALGIIPSALVVVLFFLIGVLIANLSGG